MSILLAEDTTLHTLWGEVVVMRDGEVVYRSTRDPTENLLSIERKAEKELGKEWIIEYRVMKTVTRYRRKETELKQWILIERR